MGTRRLGSIYVMIEALLVANLLISLMVSFCWLSSNLIHVKKRQSTGLECKKLVQNEGLFKYPSNR